MQFRKTKIFTISFIDINGIAKLVKDVLETTDGGKAD
jgi:hypothetical protein